MKHNRRWTDFDKRLVPFNHHKDMLRAVTAAIEEFTSETCVWTRSGIDLDSEQKIYATACNKEWPYMSVPPHKILAQRYETFPHGADMICHGCGKRIVEEFLS